MRILYIITQADGGGAQKYVLSLAKHFRGTIASGDEAKKLFEDAEAVGLTTYKLKHLKRNIDPWHDFFAIWEIRKLIKFLKPDIIHLNSTKAGTLGSFACIGLKTKVIFTAHGFRFNEPLSFPVKNFYLSLEKTASTYRDFIITVSDADKKSALDNKIINKNKIQTIHNGIPQIDFLPQEESRKALNLSDSKFTFGTIANFYESKGLDILVDAISKLREDIKSKYHFFIIGDGKEKKDLEFKILNLKLENSIKLPGNIENASKYLKAFNAFILPSRKEGFPFVLLEAMQAGLPIIATDVGGNKEALGDTGILIAPEEPSQLAQSISAITLDGALAINLSNKALERSKLFTEQKMLSKTESIYEKFTKPTI